MLQLVLKQSKKERRMMRFEDITADPCEALGEQHRIDSIVGLC